jgi:hypothetical protein
MAKNIKLFLFISFLLATLIFLFYGNSLKTWFQQDEWAALGIYPGNSLSNIFLDSLTPDFRSAFTPFSAMFTTILVRFFGFDFNLYITTSLVMHFINSLLVYIYTIKLTNNKQISILAAILFATSGLGQKAITWVGTSSNTLPAATFSLVTLILFNSFITTNRYRYLLLSLVSFWTALWFKETAFPLFVILPTILLIYKHRETKKSKIITALAILSSFTLIYFSLRILLSIPESTINQASDQLPRFLTIKEMATFLTWLPLRGVVDVFLLPNTIYQVGRIVASLYKFVIIGVGRTFQYGYFAETTGIDVTTLIAAPIIIGLLYLLYKRLFSKNEKLITIFWVVINLMLMSAMATSILLIIRGTVALKLNILRSRDLYLSTVGTSIFFSLVGITFWQKLKEKKYLQKILLISVAILYLIYNWRYINTFILPEEILKAEIRKPILYQIYNAYPLVPKKVIFYTESDTIYYGSATVGMPFQTGFGRALIDIYIIRDSTRPRLPNGNAFLYPANSQGYKEDGEYGFGYYTDLKKLVTTVKEYKLETDSIIAFSWSGKTGNLENITWNTRNEVKKLLLQKP